MTGSQMQASSTNDACQPAMLCRLSTDSFAKSCYSVMSSATLPLESTEAEIGRMCLSRDRRGSQGMSQSTDPVLGWLLSGSEDSSR